MKMGTFFTFKAGGPVAGRLNRLSFGPLWFSRREEGQSWLTLDPSLGKPLSLSSC